MAREIFDFVLTFVEYKYILISEVKKTQIKQSEVTIMKTTYEFTKKADIQACKELARTMIKRDIAVNGEAYEANYYEYIIAKFFDCMNGDFRNDFTNWIQSEIDKRNA